VACNSEGTDKLPEDGTQLPKHVAAAKCNNKLIKLTYLLFNPKQTINKCLPGNYAVNIGTVTVYMEFSIPKMRRKKFLRNVWHYVQSHKALRTKGIVSISVGLEMKTGTNIRQYFLPPTSRNKYGRPLNTPSQAPFYKLTHYSLFNSLKP
jgi:hypothetical protein